jgi:hypothetical protein
VSEKRDALVAAAFEAERAIHDHIAMHEHQHPAYPQKLAAALLNASAHTVYRLFTEAAQSTGGTVNTVMGSAHRQEDCP